jgi:hypothetical protein
MRIFLCLILISSCATAFSQEETATGYGGSFDEALENAKNLVTEQAAGTFITSRQNLVNDHLTETAAQYDGGFINHYDVKNTNVDNGVYRVTITADVDTNKINNVIEGGTSSVSDETILAVQKIADNEKKTTDAWGKLNSVSPQLAVKVIDSQYSVSDGKVYLYYNLRIGWNPKWYDDALNLAKASSMPISDDSRYALCFRNRAGEGGCGVIPFMPANITSPSFNTITATVHFKDGTSRDFTFGQETPDGFVTSKNEVLVIGSLGNLPALSVASYVNPIARVANIAYRASRLFGPAPHVYSLTFVSDMTFNRNISLQFSVEQFKNVQEVTIN